MWALMMPFLASAEDVQNIPSLPCSFDLTTDLPEYSDAAGYGYDFHTKPASSRVLQPFYFSVRVPDGNYRVTVTLGHRRMAASTAIRAESRRLFVEETPTKKGKYLTYTFLVNKRSPRIDDQQSVRLKPREHTYLNWDDRLTFEFAGSAPAVRSISITPDTTSTTLYLIGNSTVVDQESEPYASWGQMVPRWLSVSDPSCSPDHPLVAVSNHAESGLACSSFLAQLRLDKILSTLRQGDFVFVEFGHNDQKEHGVGDGPWYNFSHNLKIFVDRVRAKGGNIAFLTPTQRRSFDENGRIRETHGEYPDAMRAVAAREQVPVIELHDMTRTFFEALGVEGSKSALVHYPANTYPHQPKPLADNTHFNPYGAYEVSRMVIQSLLSTSSPTSPSSLASPSSPSSPSPSFFHPLLLSISPSSLSLFPFDPSHPDSPSSLRLPPASKFDTTKPDGN